MMVYIASPYSIGNKDANVKRSFDTFITLRKLDYIPFTPMFSHYINKMHAFDWDTWMRYDLQIIKRCDRVLRLDGESRGADIETKYARNNNIPVFYSLKEMLEYDRKL